MNMSSSPLHVVIAGGTGHAGELLARHWHERGHAVTVLGRYPKAREWTTVHWEPPEPGLWMDSLEGAHVLVNLAGYNVNARDSALNRKRILESRLIAIRSLADTVAQSSHPPLLWIHGSSVAVYGSTGETPADDFSPLIADDLIAQTAIRSEEEFMRAPAPNSRKIALRSGLIMSPHAGGSFVRFMRLMRFGLADRLGSGRQFVSWIQDFDWLRALDFLIAHEDIAGAVNACSPNPLINAQFMAELRHAWNPLKMHFPAPSWAVEAAAFALGQEATELLQSRRAIPSRLQANGFVFDFPEWHNAVPGLLSRWREMR